MESTLQEAISSLKKIKAITFDLDGTLLGADTFALSFEFMNRFIRFHRPFLGKLKSIQFLHALRSEIERSEGPPSNFERGVKVASDYYGVSSERAERILYRALKKVFYPLEHHFYPIPGALKLVQTCASSFPLYLVTNPVWPKEFVELRLNWSNISSNYFLSMTHAQRMNSCKPKESFYHDFIKQEGLVASECLHIGNDDYKDLIARRVGFSVFILNSTQSELKPLRIPRPTSLKGPAWSGNMQNCQELVEKLCKSR